MTEHDPRTDQRWFTWATVVVAGFLAFSLTFGLLILPGAQAPNAGLDWWTAICRAVGIAPGSPAQPQPVNVAMAAPVSEVEWSPRTLAILNSGNVTRGRELAEQVCIACHGERGMSISADYPRIAGQTPEAIYKQLSDYRTGARAHVLMTPVAQQLTEDELAAVAAYFGRMREGPVLGSATISSADPEMVRLIHRGDPARRLAPCQSCHVNGSGGPPETPAIAGQNRAYLERQLRAFRDGTRQNDTYRRMRDITAELSDEEIARLAATYEGNY
jgi:cytochrome c553